jgi:hypothetical protein
MRTIGAGSTIFDAAGRESRVSSRPAAHPRGCAAEPRGKRGLLRGNGHRRRSRSRATGASRTRCCDSRSASAGGAVGHRAAPAAGGQGAGKRRITDSSRRSPPWWRSPSRGRSRGLARPRRRPDVEDAAQGRLQRGRSRRRHRPGQAPRLMDVDGVIYDTQVGPPPRYLRRWQLGDDARARTAGPAGACAVGGRPRRCATGSGRAGQQRAVARAAAGSAPTGPLGGPPDRSAVRRTALRSPGH